jgi:hypothetical protein
MDQSLVGPVFHFCEPLGNLYIVHIHKIRKIENPLLSNNVPSKIKHHQSLSRLKKGKKNSHNKKDIRVRL